MSLSLASIRRYSESILFWAIAIPLLVRLFHLSVNSASDFEVYWYAIHAWVSNQNPYSQYSTVYPGLVFKYPPWILPIFLPFGWISLSLSKWIWTFAQVLCIFYSIDWIRLRGVRLRVVSLVALAFWWMWLAHAHFGQVTVFILAFALWTHGPPRAPFSSPAKISFLVDLLTTKVFSLVSLIGILKSVLQFRTIFYGVSIFLLSHFLLLVTRPKMSFNQAPSFLIKLYTDWVHAAASGGAELGATIVRGQQNHGFVAAILRIFNVGATQVKVDILVAGILSLLFSFLWYRFAKNLKSEEKWAGWLAIGVICHPLAWHHSFTLTFPLCAFSLNRSLEIKNKTLVALSFLGICFIALFIPQVIGTNAVVPLEYVGSKSWGVLFSAISIILAEKQRLSKSKYLQI